MKAEQCGRILPMTDYYKRAQKTFDTEINALVQLRDRLDHQFDDVVEKILTLNGRIVFIGIGKSGIIGDKISASFSSIGIPSFSIDAGVAYHGDLGRVAKDDLAIFISNSGETQEVIQAMLALQNIHHDKLVMVAMTGNPTSTLAKNVQFVLNIGNAKEADVTGMAPTTSTTATLVLGDALLVALEEALGFSKEKFALYHPGGSIGKMLLQRIKHVMHQKIPYVHEDTPINDVIYRISDYGIGITLVKSNNDEVIGIVTDGDIRKKFLGISGVKGSVAKDYMTYGFISVNENDRNRDAWRKMANHNISNLVVLNDIGTVVGIVTIHDVLE